MPATNSRAKQRTLIRWNDDLDKSLLLFMHHTCNEMGIKIPYDEIGRRMGANFSEGAIVQHIAKLRGKMADLNVAPVPGPSKRGQAASRPSSVYTSKSRANPPPAPPSISATSRGRVRRSETARPTGVTKARAQRKGSSRRIKRSESDIEEEDDEDIEGQDLSGSPATGRQRRSSDQSTNSRVLSHAQPGRSHVSRSIAGLLQANPYDAEVPSFSLPNYGLTQDQQAFPYVSIEQDQPVYNGFSNYALADGSGDEEEIEEEEDSLPMLARNAAGQHQYQLHPPVSNNVSPKSGGQMALPFHNAGTTQNTSPFTYGDISQQQMQQSRAYSSNNYSNYDYSGYNTGSGLHTPFMAPASAFPTPVVSNMPGPTGSQSSSRNDSLASQAGQDGNAAIPQTPVYERSQSAMVNQVSSPQSQQGVATTTQDDLLDSAIAVTSGMHATNLDWDFTTFHDNSLPMPDFLHGQTSFLNSEDYDSKACGTFFQNTFATDMDQMDLSGSSQ